MESRKLKMTGFSVVLIIGMLALFSACGKKEAPAASAEKGSKTIEELKIGVSTLPDNMDPAHKVGNNSIRIHYNVFETLILADQKDNFKLKPMLAESWKRIDDFTLEFKLRKGVQFHNGDELTAEDVKFSFDRILKPNPNYELARSLLTVIKDIQVVDPLTVRFVTKTTDPLFEQRVAANWGAWIVPKKYLTSVGAEAFAQKPMGTGPYKVESFDPTKVLLERFDKYWGAAPAAKKIEYRVIPEASARITSMINKEIDILVQLPPDQFTAFAKYDYLNVVGLPITNIHVIYYNTAAGPLKNVKLRQALNLAINRRLLVDTLWNGRAEVPRGHQYKEYGEFYFADYPLPEYNVEKAKQLVAESGYKGEVIEYELRPGYYTFGTEAAEAIVDMWKKIGVTAKVVFRDKQQDKFVRNWSNTMRFPDPAGGLWLLWNEESAPQQRHWKNASAEFNKTGNALQSILDKEKRRALARKLMELWDAEAPGTVLYAPYESWVIRKGLKWTPYSSQAMDFRADNFSVE